MFSQIIALVSLSIAALSLIRDSLISFKAQKFKIMEFNYNNKLKLYSEFMHLHLCKDFINDTETAHRLLYLAGAINLICTDETAELMKALFSAWDYGTSSPEYRSAFNSCITSMRKELSQNSFTQNKHKQKST